MWFVENEIIKYIIIGFIMNFLNKLHFDKLVEKQTTISKPISFSGIGIHNGKAVNITLLRADSDVGIVFKRIDIEINNEITQNDIVSIQIGYNITVINSSTFRNCNNLTTVFMFKLAAPNNIDIPEAVLVILWTPVCPCE